MTKLQLLLYLAIGNLLVAFIYNPPVLAWDLATGFADMMNGIHDALAPTKTDAQTPLAVPQMEAPIGNSTSGQPCLAPPPPTLVANDLAPVSVAPVPKRPVIPASPEPVNFPSSVSTPSGPIPDRLDYNQAGGVTQATVDRMAKFKKNQSYKAIKAILGTPNYREPGADIYIIRGTGDRFMAPRKFIVSYAFDAVDNFNEERATDWYQQ